MSKIDVEKIPVRKIFSDDFFFRIPEYQRPYSWKTEHCEQLFDDIYESTRSSEYFLGTVVLQEVGKVGVGTKYDIIDGQQRITTLQLLLACLRDAVEEMPYQESTQQKIYQQKNPADGIPEKVRLESREKEFFQKCVQLIDSTKNVQTYEPNNDSQEHLKNAVLLFRKKILKLKQSGIKALIEHISQRCVLIYVSTEEFNDAYKLFSIINDRGLQLRRVDILKASSLEPSIISVPEERIEYAKIWETIENDLGSDEFENLISFIRTMIIKEKAREDILTEYNNLIFGKGVINRGKDFIQYVKDIKDIYQKVVLDKDIFDHNDSYIHNSIPYKNLVHIMLDYLPSNEWIPPLIAYYKKFRIENLYEFAQKLEQKFLADWVMGMTSTKRGTNMNSILKHIDHSSKSDEVISSNVFDYDKKLFSSILSQDIYGKSYDKYLLLKLEYLESEQNIERRYGTLSIEHVLPQNPKSGSEWNKKFVASSRGKWVNKIANLVLLSRRKNSSLSNRDFKYKKENYFQGKMSDLTRSLKILTLDDWTPEVLEERQQSILNLLQ